MNGEGVVIFKGIGIGGSLFKGIVAANLGTAKVIINERSKISGY